jgi:hypothetical protein
VSVLGLGDALLRLSAPGRQRLEHAAHLEAHVGGAELNALIAVAAFGTPATWVTPLADNPLGRRIAAHAAGHGVEAVVDWDEDSRTPLYGRGGRRVRRGGCGDDRRRPRPRVPGRPVLADHPGRFAAIAVADEARLLGVDGDLDPLASRLFPHLEAV